MNDKLKRWLSGVVAVLISALLLGPAAARAEKPRIAVLYFENSGNPELEMLKQMEEDMMSRTKFMEKLIEARGEDVSELDLALLERLAHRHNKVTEIFLALKKQIEDAMNPAQQGGETEDRGGKKDGGK